MSAYVDRFIKQHKEYFKRNESFVDNNHWNDSSRYESNLDNLTEELMTLSKNEEIDAEEKSKQIKKLKSSIVALGKEHQETKAKLFRQENDLTDSIVNRLSSFIKETEKIGERRKNPKVQKFIDFTANIVYKHIEKCDSYLNYNLDVLQDDGENDYEIDYKGQEITFQDTIFKEKIGIQDNLENLNISGDVENLKIEYLRDEKAAIPMMSVLPHLNRDIKRLTDKLDIPKKIFDKGFYIHKKDEEIPEWDDKKHYWEQEPEALKFWYNEWLKITKGFEVDGYFIHPWLYYHLNFFKTPMPTAEGGDKIDNPLLRDNEWYIAELLKNVTMEDGYYTHSGILLYGSRRIAKSTSMSSICEWRALIIPNISTAITSGSEGDLTELTHKMTTSMKYKEPAFRLIAQTSQWDGGQVKLGLKTKDQKIIEHSRHTIKNLAGGGKNATQKTAGGAPSVYLIEEIGKFDWEKSYLAALPSFQSDFGLKTLIIAVGTGGEASLSGDAMRALANPKALKFLEMDWDMLEKRIPKEAITWKRRTFANFVPGQMGMKTGFKRIEKKFGDFLGIDSEALNKITIFETDWETNTRVLLEDRAKVKNDNLKLQQEKVQYPIDPEECFLSAEENPFPSMAAKKHKDHIESVGEVGRPVDLYRNNDGKVCYEESKRMYPSFPYPGGHHESPITLYEDPPENPNVNSNLYIAGYDDYKHEASDGDSLGSIVVFKRNYIGEEWENRIVASYHARPDPHSEFHKNSLMLLELYGAKLFMENEDMDFKMYLDRRYLTETYLVQGFDMLSEFSLNTNNNRQYGWQPTAKNKRALLGQAINYTKEDLDIKDKDGAIIKSMLGVQRINDTKILEEVINYKEGGNFDGLTAFMSALAYSHYLDKNYMYPDVRDRRKDEKGKKTVDRKPNMFTKKRFGMFKG